MFVYFLLFMFAKFNNFKLELPVL